MPDTIDDLKQQIRQLDALQASGALPEEAARPARAALEKRLLDAVMAGPASAGAAAAATPAAASAPPPAAAAPSRRLVAGLVLFVAAFGAAGTWWLGNRDGWNTAPGAQPPAVPTAAAAAEDSASGPHSMTVAQIQGMVDTLAARMKNEPDNAEGWLMLGRSYAVLGQFEPAIAAYRHVLQLQPKNSQALADLADAMAASSDQRFQGEPARLVEQALAADPNNLKALLLAGTVAFDKKDYAGAIKQWEKAEKLGPPDNGLVRQASENLAEARQLAGLPPAPAATPSTGGTVAIDGKSVSGRVELAAALAAKASPDDTVFVFARPTEGPRMPLAILKKKVRDLPLDFTLDDSMAMSPQARLSQAPRVVVGARVSKSGQAMPQPGDLEGLSDPVVPGAQGLKLTIGQVVP